MEDDALPPLASGGCRVSRSKLPFQKHEWWRLAQKGFVPSWWWVMNGQQVPGKDGSHLYSPSRVLDKKGLWKARGLYGYAYFSLRGSLLYARASYNRRTTGAAAAINQNGFAATYWIRSCANTVWLSMAGRTVIIIHILWSGHPLEANLYMRVPACPLKGM